MSVALHASDSAEHRRRFKVVRMDSLQDVEGEIVAADEDTGECILVVGGEARTLTFGPGAIKILARGSA